MSARPNFGRAFSRTVFAGCAIAVMACGAPANLSVKQGTGPTPMIPSPKTSLIPVINVADARGWENGDTPAAAPGLSVNAFAKGLNHPRWLYVLPNGDVLVAETNAPDRPDDGYKVIFVPFTNGRPSGDAIDVLTGFIEDNGDAMGRPVGVAIDKNGSLLVADDVGNTVWRVSGRGQLPR